MAMPLMTNTLPTIIGMGVVSHATDTMFGRRGRGKTSSRSRGKPVPAAARRVCVYTVYFSFTDAKKRVRRGHTRVISGSIAEIKQNWGVLRGGSKYRLVRVVAAKSAHK